MEDKQKQDLIIKTNDKRNDLLLKITHELMELNDNLKELISAVLRSGRYY